MKNLLSKLRETMPLPLKNQGESWDFSSRQSVLDLEVAFSARHCKGFPQREGAFLERVDGAVVLVSAFPLMERGCPHP